MALAENLRLRISHIRFSVAFSALLYAVCNALNIDKLTKWFYGANGVDYAALSAYLLAGLCVFIAFFALVAHRRTVKPMAIVLTIVSAGVTYFISKYNVAIDRSMIMNTIHTDSTEVGQLLSAQMIPYVLFLMLVPTAIIAFADITFKPAAKYLWDSFILVAVSLTIALASLYLNYNAIHRAGNVSNKYIVYSLVPINFLAGGISAASKELKPLLAARKQDVRIAGSVAAQDNLVVVLAIGETSRRKNFSLYGYDRRNTNPVLQRVSGLHLLNGIVTRGSTLDALPEILEKKDIKLTALTSKLGIPTSCYVNYTLYDNCAVPGEIKVGNCSHGGNCYDEDVVPLLEENLKSYASGYRFIVLHLGGGSHGPTYSDRHPPEFQAFKPLCTDADVANKCTLEQLYNSYDNTILYVDHVLGEIVQRLERSGAPYVFIYLSDHGESLLEEGRMFHGMPPGVSLPPEQAEIPLIVKSSIPISIVERDTYHSHDVFDSVLDLFSIESPAFDKSASFLKKRGGSVVSNATANAAPTAKSR